MTCPACHQTETQGCKSCRAQSLARIFLAKGERGQKLRRACEQLGVTVEEVQAAHEAMLQEPAPTDPGWSPTFRGMDRVISRGGTP